MPTVRRPGGVGIYYELHATRGTASGVPLVLTAIRERMDLPVAVCLATGTGEHEAVRRAVVAPGAFRYRSAHPDVLLP